MSGTSKSYAFAERRQRAWSAVSPEAKRGFRVLLANRLANRLPFGLQKIKYARLDSNQRPWD